MVELNNSGDSGDTVHSGDNEQSLAMLLNIRERVNLKRKLWILSFKENSIQSSSSILKYLHVQILKNTLNTKRDRVGGLGGPS